MYDQTGNHGEGNAAGYNTHHTEGSPGGQGPNANPEDIFSQFKGFGNQRGGHAGGFEDILKDFFGGGRSHTQRQSSH